MKNIAISSSIARPDVTVALTRGVSRLFIDLGLTPICEFKLPNGRRADIAALDRAGKVVIAEIKSCRADFAADNKWIEYLGFCDRYYFATDSEFPHGFLPEEEGLIVADGFGGSIIREAVERPLAPARRRSVTLRFARQAARLCLVR